MADRIRRNGHTRRRMGYVRIEAEAGGRARRERDARANSTGRRERAARAKPPNARAYTRKRRIKSAGKERTRGMTCRGNGQRTPDNIRQE